jgi:hypothetical protein
VCHDLAPAIDSVVHTTVAAVDLYMHRCDVSRRDLQLVRSLLQHTQDPGMCNGFDLMVRVLLALQLGAAAILRGLRTCDVHIESATERLAHYTVGSPRESAIAANNLFVRDGSFRFETVLLAGGLVHATGDPRQVSAAVRSPGSNALQ